MTVVKIIGSVCLFALVLAGIMAFELPRLPKQQAVVTVP